MNINTNIKLITVLGPTATGKTNLAVKIASLIDSEIISADSRQIYKGMDIGTGKDLDEYQLDNKSIPYHLIDIINPNENYSVYSFQKDFHVIYNQILKRNKFPILCGGTGLYIESILLNYQISSTKPDYALRNNLEKLSKSELLKFFKDLDETAYRNWKCDTKQRIIRGIEISLKGDVRSNSEIYELDLDKTIILGIYMDRNVIRERITKRLEYRLNNGMIEEVESLLKNGVVTIDRLNYFGLEYKYLGHFLDKKISYEEMFNKLNTAIHKFAKKQMTFFRRMEKRGVNINWINDGDFEEVLNVINSI